VIPTLFEYDTGSEGMSELGSKAKRYGAVLQEYRVGFVLPSVERWEQVRKTITERGLLFVVMDEFETLRDPTFRQIGTEGRVPFFSAGAR